MKFEILINENKGNPLLAVTPVDGRYAKATRPLAGYFSEFALIYHRWVMEIRYLLALNDLNLVRSGTIKMPIFSDEQMAQLEFLQGEYFTIEIAQEIKDAEVTTNHDVKAVEYVLKEKLRNLEFSEAHLAHVHFGLTSEDVSNFAYASMLMSFRDDVYLEEVEDSHNDLLTLAHDNSDKVLIARTHGQPATPTTFGKEMRIYAERVKRQLDTLREFKMRVKLAGASGNWNGHYIAYPEVNWPQFVYEFVKKYYNDGNDKDGNFEVNYFVNQIEDHDTFAELFQICANINNILYGFAQDIWLYTSYDLLKQKPKENEVGSSAMPHKVNPLNFENAWGNLGMANTQFDFFCRKLTSSFMQRDLSDSTVIRYFGQAFGCCLVAFDNLAKGIRKIEVNEKKMQEDLSLHFEVVAEAYQLILKREGMENAYELLKKFTRGKEMTMELLHGFVDTLNVDTIIATELKAITPETYVGRASQFAVCSSYEFFVDKYAHLKD